MSNHVTTRCTIRGSSAEVTAFQALMVEDTPPPAAPAAGTMARLRALLGRTASRPHPARPLPTFDFDRILPMPGTVADGPGQAAWALEHWGTQRNAECYDETARHDDGAGDASLEFSLVTAWSFPAPVFEALHRRFPALRVGVVGFEEAWHFAIEGGLRPRRDGSRRGRTDGGAVYPGLRRAARARRGGVRGRSTRSTGSPCPARHSGARTAEPGMTRRM